MKKSLVITITIFLLLQNLFSQTSKKELGFFAPLYNTKDETTAKLIVDLYYNHLLTNNTIHLVNLRSTPFSESIVLEDFGINIALSIDISEINENWTIDFHIISPEGRQNKKISHDSYFQILLEAKNEIFNLIEMLDTLKTASNTNLSDNVEKQALKMTLDSIAGTWFTDTNIDKIIILRGGRGFVIFKNGASMNISVQIKGSQIIALQTSQANASFLPDLPRELALKVAAENLAPLEWVMTARTENEMVGEKKHYEAVYEDGKASSVKAISSPSKWTR